MVFDAGECAAFLATKQEKGGAASVARFDPRFKMCAETVGQLKNGTSIPILVDYQDQRRKAEASELTSYIEILFSLIP